METISGCTIVRNAVLLKYPLEASIRTYYDLCDEVVLAYDPTSEDSTEEYVHNLAGKYPKIRLIKSKWNLSNHQDGTEITIQSNVAIQQCRAKWVLYVQADEAIHEDDHWKIKAVLEDTSTSSVLFDRRSFLFTLGQEIPEYFAKSLLRLFRNGEGQAVGDAMTCATNSVHGKAANLGLRMFNYSRMGERDEILVRSRYRDNFHHDNEAGIAESSSREFTQKTVAYNVEDHPTAIREFYADYCDSLVVKDNGVALAVLLGKGEHEKCVSFLNNFSTWKGEIIIIDDSNDDGGWTTFETTARHTLKYGVDRIRKYSCLTGNDFGTARNLAHEQARSPWILHADLDETWDINLLNSIEQLALQLCRDSKSVCGFMRANFLNGNLVNDLPSSEWFQVNAGLTYQWPPQNKDTQLRLVRKYVNWAGKLHEHPIAEQNDIVVLKDVWIVHNKSVDRQRKQDSLYKSKGQVTTSADFQLRPNLRECVLWESVHRLGREGSWLFVETGTLRNAEEQARLSDGWSTWCMAYLIELLGKPASKLISIDINDQCLATSQKVVSDHLKNHVEWVKGNSVDVLQALQDESIDLLYLDSADDPELTLLEFKIGITKIKKQGIIIIDDTGPYFAGPQGKGTKAIPFALDQGWRVENRSVHNGSMTIITSKD